MWVVSILRLLEPGWQNSYCQTNNAICGSRPQVLCYQVSESARQPVKYLPPKCHAVQFKVAEKGNAQVEISQNCN